jgi:hypothetical protein
MAFLKMSPQSWEIDSQEGLAAFEILYGNK